MRIMFDLLFLFSGCSLLCFYDELFSPRIIIAENFDWIAVLF